MAMGTRGQRQRQEELWYRRDLAEASGHPFYRRLNELLEQAGFDKFCEAQCEKFYHETLGRPSLAPGMYFRLLLIVPNRNTRSEERRRLQKQRWFKNGQKWRTGCEGRSFRSASTE